MASLVDSGVATGGKGGTVSVTLSAAPTSGNILVAGLVVDTSLTSFNNSLIDGGSGALTMGTDTLYLYYRVCDGTESATTTATISAGSAGLWVAEFSGVDTLLDERNNTGTGTSVSVGSSISSGAGLNVVAVGSDGASVTWSSPPSGFTLDNSTTGGPCSHFYYDATGQNVDFTATQSVSDDWAVSHLTFELASSGQQILTLRKEGY